MIVRYVGSKDVYDDDGECARQLVAAGAKLMCQRTFTTAVATVCAENDIPVIGNDINIIDIAPKEAITSATTDWSVYYTYAVNAVMEGTEMEADWCGSYQDGSVYLTQLNDSILVDGTVDKIKDVEKSLRSGKCKVFDTTKFTVEGESLESLVSGSDTYKSYKKYVSNGAYHESSKRSAPTMKFLVDGVSKITGNYLETEDTTDAESETDNSTDSSTE
jgi:basic membrane protein A